MNIVIIMSGGVGARFGAVIPKQYNLIAGRPVIEYVIDAVQKSRKTDQVVIVMDEQWRGYSKRLQDPCFDFAPNGSTRLESMLHGLELIKQKYPCEKVVIVDAVAPFLYPELIDDYFDKLDTYDAVITAQKITGGLTDIHDANLDRENFIVTQSPEGFRFDLLYDHFQVDFPYQETAGMLPAGSKRWYNFGFKNNLKLTYDFELAYAEFMLKKDGIIDDQRRVFTFFDQKLLVTEGLESYLLRNEPDITWNWLNEVYTALPSLLDKWQVTSFLPNQISRFGLVLQAKSQIYGDVILKFIPAFIGRFERELEAMRLLPKSYMCALLDADEENRCMLLERISPAGYARFEEQDKLEWFFHHAVSDAVPFDEEKHQLTFIPDYFEELKGKRETVAQVPYCRDEVTAVLDEAIELYESRFKDANRYILHGDLHELNILDNGKRFWGIDPNGMLAPLELECVRFIRNDVRNHPSCGYQNRFEKLMDYFSRFVRADKLADMFIIDMAFCTYNSTFENEEPDETLVDLELIRIARESHYRQKT